MLGRKELRDCRPWAAKPLATELLYVAYQASDRAGKQEVGDLHLLVATIADPDGDAHSELQAEAAAYRAVNDRQRPTLGLFRRAGRPRGLSQYAMSRTVWDSLRSAVAGSLDEPQRDNDFAGPTHRSYIDKMRTAWSSDRRLGESHRIGHHWADHGGASGSFRQYLIRSSASRLKR